MTSNSIIRACAVAVLCLLTAISCDRDRPTAVDDAVSQPQSAVRPNPSILIEDVADFETEWANGTFANNHTFTIKSGSVLTFPSNRTFGESAANGKSFSIVGQDTTAVLRKDPPTTPLFDVHDDTDNGTPPRSILIDNIKFEAVGNGSLFSNFTGYGNITVTDAVIDLEGHTFLVSCDNLLIDASHIRARSNTGLNHLIPGINAFDHTIRNSTFVRKHNGVGNGNGPCRANFTSAPSGTFTCENNEFIATAASEGEPFYTVRVINADTPLDFVFDGNNFGGQTLFFDGSCINATVELMLADNNSDFAFCGDGVGTNELIVCDNCDDPVDFDLVVTLAGWSFEGDPFDYGEIISGQNACYSDNTVYVEFDLATLPAGQSYSSVKVQWGDENCTTGVNEVTPTINPDTGLYNALFDVSGSTNADIYWRAKATLCGKDVFGDCIRRRFTLCGAGGVPVWFTQE